MLGERPFLDPEVDLEAMALENAAQRIRLIDKADAGSNADFLEAHAAGEGADFLDPGPSTIAFTLDACRRLRDVQGKTLEWRLIARTRVGYSRADGKCAG